MKNFKLLIITILFASMAFSISASAFDRVYVYSPRWYQSEDEVWHINTSLGENYKGVWICDYESSMDEAPWYLIDENGDMIADPVVKDVFGNYYYFNSTIHDGSYGYLVHTDGVYDGIYLEFNQDHEGKYGAIKNVE